MASTWITFTQIQVKLNNQIIFTKICANKQTTVFRIYFIRKNGSWYTWITNSFKKYKNFYIKDRILSLTVHNKLQYNITEGKN